MAKKQDFSRDAIVPPSESSTDVVRDVFAASVKNVDKKQSHQIAAMSAKEFRSRYPGVVVNNVKACCISPENAIQACQDGLNHLKDKFSFVRGDQKMSFAEAMSTFKDNKFETGMIKGKGAFQSQTLRVPYKDAVLTGNKLLSTIEGWVKQGIIEPSCASAMVAVAENPDWLDLSDLYFVLLGACSAMGPFELLVRLGANIIAIDINMPHIWKRLITTTRETAGTLIFPMSKPQAQCGDDDALFAAAGCNLLTETPEIRNWLVKVQPGARLVVGGYCYLNGMQFVKIALAMDGIIESLCTERRDVALAFLCTPTDAHVVPETAVAASRSNFARRKWWHGLLKLMGAAQPRRNFFATAALADGTECSIVDAIVKAQSFNYILAKRLQHWRCVIARAQGHVVSTNIAPSTSTVSVTQNWQFNVAYQGMHYFQPMEVFHQETSNAVMGTLLIHDLRHPLSVANPKVPLPSPMHLFTSGSFHGGAWRCGYKFNSFGTASALCYVVSFVLFLYLLCYNAAQVGGWSMVLWKALSNALTKGLGSDVVWDQVEKPLMFFQTLMLLDVVHSAIGMVRAPVMTTFMQTASRLMVMNSILYSQAAKGPQLNVALTVLPWAITEVVRYSFYFFKLTGADSLSQYRVLVPFLAKFKVGVPGFLKFLRYTLFFVLYPAGVSGELWSMWLGRSELAKASLDAPWAVQAVVGPLIRTGFWFLAAIYAVGFPVLFGHMVAQRKKELGGSARGKQGKK